jgi:hypothetical protein
MKKLEKKTMKQIMGGGGAANCRCVADNELGCCWDSTNVPADVYCPKGSYYACFIPYCWQLPCANPADDSL